MRSSSSTASSSHGKDTTEAVMEFLGWKKTLAANLQIPEERWHTFALCNMSSPRMSQANYMAFFGACESCMAQGQNPMAVIMLQFAQKQATSTWQTGRSRTSS